VDSGRGLYLETRRGRPKKLKFSDLSNDEIAMVMEANRRKMENRGVMGFFRRLGRKMEGPPPEQDIDAGNC